MHVTRWAPGARLAPFVRHYTIVETREEATRVLIPETGLVLGVRYGGSATQLDGGGETRLADAAMTGIARTARRIRTSARGGMIVAAFRDAGAAQFFTAPLHELCGKTVALDELLSPSELDRVRGDVASAADHAGRVAALERFLTGHLREQTPDPVVEAAVRAIRGAGGSVRIGALARRLGISQDPLEKRFRRAVGASPKRFASLVRLRSAIAAHRGGVSLSRVAHESGYSDQSHFIRAFRSILGQSPAQFFRSAEHC
jgi:AraC-like DNA-binding protein